MRPLHSRSPGLDSRKQLTQVGSEQRGTWNALDHRVRNVPDVSKGARSSIGMSENGPQLR